MLVRFKKTVAQEAPKKPPVRVPARDKDWDESKVETPEPRRRLKAFEKKQEFVAILEYRKNAKSGGPRIQKLAFKSEGGFAGAAQAAYKIAHMVGKALAIDLHEIRNEQLCRVIAVYEINSFQDWSKHNVVDSKKTKYIDAAVKAAKKDKINPISYTSITDIKVR